MNNLLSHLAARSFEAPATLRPRVRSIFEPLHNRIAPSPSRVEDERSRPSRENESLEEQREFAAFTEQDEARSQRTRRDTDRLSPTRRVNASTPEIAHRDAENHAVEERIESNEPPPSQARRETQTHAQPRPSLAPARLRPAVQVDPQAKPQDAAAEPRHEVREAAGSRRHEADSQEVSSPPRPAAGRPASENRERSTASLHTAQDERRTILRKSESESRPSFAPPLPTLAPSSRLDTAARLLPRRDDKKPSASTSPAPQVERSVHVTIGRIDIVAEMPPQTPQRRSTEKSPAGITLEEYLRRRRTRGAQ